MPNSVGHFYFQVDHKFHPIRREYPLTSFFFVFQFQFFVSTCLSCIPHEFSLLIGLCKPPWQPSDWPLTNQPAGLLAPCFTRSFVLTLYWANMQSWKVTKYIYSFILLAYPHFFIIYTSTTSHQGKHLFIIYRFQVIL